MCVDIVEIYLVIANVQISSIFDTAHHTSLVLLPDNNLSKNQWISTKLDMCIYILEIWFGIANGQLISSAHTQQWEGNIGSIFYSEEIILTFHVKCSPSRQLE